MIPCECDRPSVDHAPGACDFGASLDVLRDGQRVRVCICCTLTGDRDRREIEV